MSGPDRQLLRRLRLYRPYPDAVPWTLFDALEPDTAWGAELPAMVEAALAEPPELHLRVARLEEETVAAYFLEQLPGYHFRLRFLLVDERWRRRGIGRWVVGHALGLAESKGGQALTAPSCGATRRFLLRYGFAPTSDGEDLLRFDFVPE